MPSSNGAAADGTDVDWEPPLLVLVAFFALMLVLWPVFVARYPTFGGWNRREWAFAIAGGVVYAAASLVVVLYV